MALGISSKLRGSIKYTSATAVEMPGIPITLVPAKGSSMPKSVLRARALELRRPVEAEAGADAEVSPGS